MFIRIAGVFVAVLLATGLNAQAQTYPSRNITVVVGLPAGSGGSIIARYYADKLAQVSKQTVVVENRPGMILSIGADVVAKAPPDGYTILITSVTSSHAANKFLFKHLPYDPIKDFTPVALLQQGYFILMVRPESGWTNVAQLTAAMKKKGAAASYGFGSPPALASAELYKAYAGLQAIGIPYRTSMQSLPQMFAGELDFQFFDSTQGTVLMTGGKLRGLAITAGQRVAGVDLPTMAEAANINGFDISPTWGVFLPAGAPPDIVTKLEAWFGEIAGMESTKVFLERTHATSFYGDSKALAAFIPKEIERWQALSKLAKIKPR
jgi:tripartite-type tricarboxylate transporter receptor subunit TctC